MITKQKPWQQEGDILVRCYGNAMIMEDIVKDPFEEYIRQTEPSKKELAYAWHTAIGLQAVDGLETSSYLKRIARENIEGKITLQDANRLIENYYNESSEREAGRSRAADIVSARIVTVLSEKTFTFSVPQYVGIHKRLFEGIYFHAGKIRDYNLSKDEWVLDGASVHYGNALDLLAMLEYDFRMEKEYGYRFDSVSSIILCMMGGITNRHENPLPARPIACNL